MKTPAAVLALLLVMPGGVAHASTDPLISSLPYSTTFDLTDNNGGGDGCVGPNTAATAYGSKSWTVHFAEAESVRIRLSSQGSADLSVVLYGPGGELSCGGDTPVQAGKDYGIAVTTYSGPSSSVTLTVTRSPQVGIGVVRGYRWYLAPRPGARANTSFNLGRASDIPVVLNNTPTAFRGGTWIEQGGYHFVYGSAQDKPVNGDWDGRRNDYSYGEGLDYVGRPGVVKSGRWYVSSSRVENYGENPKTTNRFSFGGGRHDVFVSGDWNGDGISTPGIFRDGRWYFTNKLGGAASSGCAFGKAGDIPVVGDWNGDGTDTPGVFRSGHWYTIDVCRGPVRSFVLGGPGDRPVVGHWR